MKITGVRTYALQAPLANCIMDARFNISARRAVLVLIETDADFSGLGEAACFGGPLSVTERVILDELAPLILGRDPLMIEQLWQLMYSQTAHHGRHGLVISALSGIDIALWDILGKVSGQPLYKILGAATDQVPAYAAGGYYGDNKTLADLAEEVEGYVQKGFTGVKIKVGRYGVADDLARIRTVRDAIGADIKLMVDANNALPLHYAIELANLMQPYQIYWFEEPVHPDYLGQCQEIAQRSTIPIAGYEIQFTRFGFLPFIQGRLVSVVQPDVTWSGGITECRRIAALAAAWGIRCIPHAYSSVVTLIANLHFAASVVGETWIEFDQTPNPLRTELAAIVPRCEDGYVRLPESPGLGIELNMEALECYCSSRGHAC